MKVLDLEKLEPEEGSEVFYEIEEFSGMVIDLPTGGSMSPCEMDSYELFYVIAGGVEVPVDEETTKLQQGSCIVTEPATLSMYTEEGVRVLGVQVARG